MATLPNLPDDASLNPADERRILVAELESAREGMKTAVDDIKYRADLPARAREAVRDHPLLAAGAAFSAGFLASGLLPGVLRLAGRVLASRGTVAVISQGLKFGAPLMAKAAMEHFQSRVERHDEQTSMRPVP